MFSKSQKSSSDTWLLVGLGNPGTKYESNRHNIGFMVLEAIADHLNINSFRSKFQGELAEGDLNNQKIILLKPQTFMNESGQSVGKTAKFYKIDPERIVIFHDELDLVPAKVRIKKGGGVAGHNGLKSVQAHLNTPDFWRVRLGIGHPGDKARVHGYVLKDFAKEELGWVHELCHASARHVDLLLAGDMSAYMSKVAADVAEVIKK